MRCLVECSFVLSCSSDVQLTRDLAPVIYHDFSLSESGTDVPIYDLSLDQVCISHGNVSTVSYRCSLYTQAKSSHRRVTRFPCLVKQTRKVAQENATQPSLAHGH